MENNKRRQSENKEVFETIYDLKNYPPDNSIFDLVVDTGKLPLGGVIKEILRVL